MSRPFATSLVWVLCLSLSSALSHAAVITAVGVDTDILNEWRTSTTAKAYDFDSDNIYGEDGSQLFTADEGGLGFQNPPNPDFRALINLPSYIQKLQYTGPASNSTHYSDGGWDLIDNPTVGSDVRSGIYGPQESNGSTPVQIFQIVVQSANSFRIGIMTDNGNGANDDLANSITVTHGMSSATLTAAANGIGDMYFFDVSGAVASDVITISGIRRGGGVGSGTTGVGGISFDSIPEPASMALLAMGSLLLASRRRSIA